MEHPILLEGIRTLEKSIYVPPEHVYALSNMLACRTIDKGGRILQCPNCGTETVVYNPCNQRGCPVCSKKNQIKWAKKLKAKLLPTGHYHLIFSLPEPIVMAWKSEPKIFINCFFHSVTQAFKAVQKDMGLKLGIVMVFQSHGRGLSYKPHMHCIVTDHGMTPDNRWVKFSGLSYNKLRDIVRDTLFPHLMKKYPAFYRASFQPLIASCSDRNWTVYPAVHPFNGDNIVGYLSRSIAGGVLDMEKNLDFDKDKDTYTITDRHEGKVTRTTLDAETFWDRYLSHIPPKGAVTVRNYGLYSNRHKETLEQIRIKEYRNESLRDNDEEPYEEECPECHHVMIVKETFTINDELPLSLRLYMRRAKGPPENGISLKTA